MSKKSERGLPVDLETVVNGFIEGAQDETSD